MNLTVRNKWVLVKWGSTVCGYFYFINGSNSFELVATGNKTVDIKILFTMLQTIFAFINLI